MKIAWTSAAALLALAPLAVSAYVAANTPAPLRAAFAEPVPLELRHKPALTEVWYFLDLSDCRVGRVHIDSLNRLHAEPGVRVIGVLMHTPADSAEAAAIVRMFGAEFPMVADHDQRWSQRLARQGFKAPAVAVLNRGELQGVYAKSPSFYASAALLGLRGSAEASSRRSIAHAEDSARMFLPGVLRPATRITHGNGVPLQRPELVAAGDAQVVVFDYGDMRVKAFALDGTPRWTFGNAARGELAFDNPMDLKISDRGEVMVLDMPSATMTVLSADGEFMRRTRLSRPVHRFAPLASGNFVAVHTAAVSQFGFRFDSAGHVAQEVQMPDDVRGVDVMARQGFIAPLPGSDSSVTAFAYGGALVFSDVRGRTRTLPTVERVDFPGLLKWTDPNGTIIERISPSATTAAIGIATDDSSVAVLWGGRSPSAGRVIDMYRRGDGRYVGSHRLPEAPIALAYSTRGLVTTTSEPGSITIWASSSP